MAQTIPFDAFLGASKSGQAIGCTIYQLDGTTVHSAFATTGWYEAPVGSGAFHHAGLSLPDAGGVAAVGISGTEYQRLALGADPVTVVWSAPTRTLTDKAGFSLSGAGVQAIWDALTSALTTTGSIGKLLVDLYSSLTATPSITIISAVSGNTVTAYRNDTWKFTITVPFTLTGYEAVAFVVKSSRSQADSDALIYVRSDAGLVTVNGAAATAGKGALTVGTNSFDVRVDIDQTDLTPANYTWWLKVFDTTPATDEGYTRAKGDFVVIDYGLRAIA